LVCLVGGSQAATAVGPDWAKRWVEDIDTLQTELFRIHPDPFAEVSQGSLEEAFAELKESLPNRGHEEIVVELARILASLGDGHTRVTLPLSADSGFFQGHSATELLEVPDLVFHPLPLRLRLLEDGVFVEQIAEEHARYVGSEIVSIAGWSMADVIEAVSPVVHRDNEMQLRFQLPDFLVLLEVLAARGVVGDLALALKEGVEVGVVSENGVSVRLQVEADSDVRLTDPTRSASGAEVGEEPLYRRDRDLAYWFTYLEESRTVYWQYNEVGDGEGESMADFADRLFGFIDTERVDRLIIDLRWNRGGSNGFNQPLLHHILRSEKLSRPGALFAITGGGTFSAAMMFAVDLERHTSVLFAGEPTGSRPNHYGDSRRLRLPNSGLTVRVSTLYWQYSNPRDSRRSIAPHLFAPLRAADVLARRDPALDGILESGTDPAESGLVGAWGGGFTVSYERQDLLVEIARVGDDYRAHLSVPGLGVERVPIDSVTVVDSEILLEQRFGESLLFLRGRVLGERFYGELGEGPSSFPFVLNRAAVRSEATSLIER